MTEVESLSIPDYVVIAITLAIPVGIGIFLAISRRKKDTKEDYLLGNRQLHVFPVTLSLFVTFMSSTSLLGMPAEIYTTGSDFVIHTIGMGLAFFIGIFTVIPVMHRLQVTSMFEYFELRFESKGLRFLVTVVGMVQKIVFCSVILLSPALTLQTVADLPFWVSCVIVAVVGIIYTSIGGIRGVVIVDVFQAVIIMTGIITVISMGISEVGGINKTWDLATEGGRILPVNWDPNPLVRHTFWSLAIGGLFSFFAYTFDQSAVQRVCAIPTMAGARIAYAANIFVVNAYFILLFLMGIVAYSYMASQGCDPFQIATVKNRNQVIPYFVLRVFEKLPGLPGLYVATIFSGALSTLSSIINGLAANTIEDILRYPLDRARASEKCRLLVAKLAVCFFGAVVIGLSFLAKDMPGTVIQTGISLLGAIGGPIVGLFFLGALTPWSNKIGGTLGLIISLAMNAWLSVGAVLYGQKIVMLPPPPGNSCHVVQNITATTASTTTLVSTTVQDSTTTMPISLYNISYLDYGITGFVVTFVIGLIGSVVTYKCTPTLTDERLLFPFVRRLWNVGEKTQPLSEKNGEGPGTTALDTRL